MRITAANVNWTGAVNNLMSVAGNYAGPGDPLAGDTIVFDPAILGKGAGLQHPQGGRGRARRFPPFVREYTGTLESRRTTPPRNRLYGNSGVQRITVDNGFTL